MDSNGEIDLKEQFVRLNRIIVSNAKSLIVAFVVGTLLGLIYNQQASPSYESKIIISSDLLTYSFVKGLIDDLQKLREERSTKSLAEKLNLSEEAVLLISRLEARPTIEKSESIQEKEKTVFSIVATVRDVTILPGLQSGIISYIETNDFVSKRVSHRKEFFKQMIAKTENEIKELEKLRAGILEGKAFSTGNMMFDPTMVNSKIVEMTKDKINFEHGLDLANSIQVIEGFTQFSRPISPKLSISLVAGASLGVLAMIVVIIVKGIRKMIKIAESPDTTQPS